MAKKEELVPIKVKPVDVWEYRDVCYAPKLEIVGDAIEVPGFDDEFEIYIKKKKDDDERIRNEILECIETLAKQPGASPRICDWIAWLEKQKEYPTNEEMLRTLRAEYEKGVADTIAKYEQKEQKDYRKLYDDIAKSDWFKKAYHGKSLGVEVEDEQKEQNDWSLYDEKMLDEIFIAIRLDSGISESRQNKLIEWLQKYRPYMNCKPAEWSEEDSDNLEMVDNYLWMLDDYVGDDCAMPQGKTDKIRGNIQGILSPWLKSLPERFVLQPKQEWSEEDEEALDMCLEVIPKKWKTKSGILLTKWLKDNIHLQSKQEWSEEDEKCIKDIIICLEYLQREDTERQWNGDRNVNPKRYEGMIAKLKSLHPQPKQEWSKEDEKMLKALNNCVDELVENHGWNYVYVETDNIPVSKVRNWINSLRFNGEKQKPVEWSEEDEKMIDHLIEALPMWANGQIAMIPSQAEEYVKRLKSLRPPKNWKEGWCEDCKVRYNRWKPSEEQMRALQMVVDEHWDVDGDALYSLYIDLKELM